MKRHYKSIIVPKRGGPEVLQIVEKDLREPSAGEARIRVLATPVVQDDVAVRVGNRPFLAKVPFTPGYSVLGIVDAVGRRKRPAGEGVANVAVGDQGAHFSFGGKRSFRRFSTMYSPPSRRFRTPYYVSTWKTHPQIEMHP